MVKSKKIQKIISELTNKIVKGYHPLKIILFGSYAYGKPTKDSDIDVFIIKDSDKRAIDRRVSVRQIVDIRDSTYPSFSPIVITPAELKKRLEIGDKFVEEILTKGKVLYDRQRILVS